MKPGLILVAIPVGLRQPLVAEYNSVVQAYMERRWGPSELSGAKFCEIVFSILDGHAKDAYLATPSKPSDLVAACRTLEKNTHVPRSFQILIPRMLPTLYEIRNNRNVGHVGGEVDPNPMDAQAVVSMCSWILGELIRVFHDVSVAEAQRTVNFVTTRRIPLVWEIDDIKRILDPRIPLKDQVLLLTGSNSGSTKVDDLYKWVEYKDKKYFLRSLRALHSARLIELSATETEVALLPPGSLYVEGLISKLRE